MSASKHGFENPVYKFLQKSRDFVVDVPEVTDDEVERRDSSSSSIPQNFTGAETQEREASLTRSDSMISIVVVEKEDLEGSYDSDDSEYGPDGFSTILIKPDAEINLKLDSEALAYLRWYLLTTAQWFPSTIWKRHKRVCKLVQYAVLVLFIISLANDFGAFGNRTLFEEEMDQPITLVKNILWDLRFLVMAVLGIHYGRKRHLEQLLSQLRLTREYWKKARRSIYKISIWALCGVILCPIFLRAMQMSLPTRQEDKQFTISQIAINSALSAIARYYCLPIFFVFVHVVFLIYCQIRLFKAQIQRWPQDQKERARDKFIDIRLMIRDAQRVFQSFLVFHVCLLLIAFIPEVFSAAERLHTESHYHRKYVTTKTQEMYQPLENVQMPQYIKYPAHQLIMVQRADKDNVTHRMLYAPLQFLNMNASSKLVQKSKSKQTPTQPQVKYTQHIMTKTDYISIAKVIAAALTDLIEIAILYSLPLVLLGKIDKLLKSLPQTIQTLKFEEQRIDSLMFQTNEDVDSMLKELTAAKSIQVLGMQINSLLAVLITLSMPLMVTVLHIMLRYVEISP